MIEQSKGLESYSIGMLLLPEFNANAAMGFLDPFRAANYLRKNNAYKWHFLSLNDAPVLASNELAITHTQAINSHDAFDLIVVNASWAPERFQSQQLQRWLKRHSANGAALAAIDTGAFVLAYAGLLKGYSATVHYEHAAAFAELFVDTQLSPCLYTEDRGRLCCAGGMAAVDFSLEMLRSHSGLDLANAVAAYVFKQQHREGNALQEKPSANPMTDSLPPALSEAIMLMERNVEEILSIEDIAKYVGISQRKMQRLFKQHSDVTPIRYYVNLRLERARGFITQTHMTVAQVAIACGFGSMEQFSRSYKNHFNLSPSQDRVVGRVPFQFRAFKGSKSQGKSSDLKL